MSQIKVVRVCAQIVAGTLAWGRDHAIEYAHGGEANLRYATSQLNRGQCNGGSVTPDHHHRRHNLHRLTSSARARREYLLTMNYLPISLPRGNYTTCARGAVTI